MGSEDAQGYPGPGRMGDGAVFGVEHLEIVMNDDFTTLWARVCDSSLHKTHPSAAPATVSHVLVGHPQSFHGRNRDEKKIQTQGKKTLQRQLVFSKDSALFIPKDNAHQTK